MTVRSGILQMTMVVRMVLEILQMTVRSEILQLAVPMMEMRAKIMPEKILDPEGLRRVLSPPSLSCVTAG